MVQVPKSFVDELENFKSLYDDLVSLNGTLTYDTEVSDGLLVALKNYRRKTRYAIAQASKSLESLEIPDEILEESVESRILAKK